MTPRPFWTTPNSGIGLLIIAGAYLLLGTVGHDPWKADDVIGIDAAWSMMQGEGWLVPKIAGDTYFANPPLYFWVSALTGKLLGWALPAHDALRLASVVFGALLFAGMGVTAGSLYGSQTRGAAVLLALGCIGLLVHIHDANPTIALLACLPWAVHGLNLLRERPGKGGAIAGWAIGLGFLAADWIALLTLVPLAILLPVISSQWRNRAALTGIAFALILGGAIACSWPSLLIWRHPEALPLWFQASLAEMRFGLDQWPRVVGYFGLLPWYAFPVLPLALWSLWLERRSLSQPGVVLPVLYFVASVFALSVTADPRSATALPLLPPLVLLAARGAGSLRRGAANGFDWFAMMTFSIFGGLVWLGWVAMLTGAPAQLANRFTKLEPGFSLAFSAAAFGVALVLSLAWIWLVTTLPRSPLRSTAHWAGGLVMFWGLLTTLWLPWIDYGKSYRSLSGSLAAALPAQRGCIAGYNVGEAQRASFHYFDNIVTVRGYARDASACDLMLVFTPNRASPAYSAGPRWQKIWEGRRPGDRNELFRLYRRNPK
jgi:4-amino-4-deoxy-L-arabinose transferase-like glycosyltransferase